MTRFVGRQHECDAIHQALERAGASHGQAVALVGEAGVGKSCLVYEVVHWRDCVGAGRSPSHHPQGWRVLESASVSYGQATPYFPVVDLLCRYSHVDDGDDARTIRAKVTGQVLTLDEALQETLPALLALLDALKRVLLRESQVQPLLVFEDPHWIDAATQALLDSLVESLPKDMFHALE
ncbi:MAG TPA: ATP-binding protein [Candidatus Tectomicrobia bacterium]